MNEGWIKLHRKFLESPLWVYSVNAHMPHLISLWIFILTSANWEEKKWYDGKTEITIPKGSLITSVGGLADGVAITNQQVRTALGHYQKMNMITIKTTSQWTQIWIVNWDKYQMKDESNNIQDNNPITNEQQTNNKPITTTKEVKNKELKNINILATDVAGGVELKSLNYFIGRFKDLNPEYEKFFSNKTERKSMAEMLNKYGFDKMESLLGQLPEIVKKPYAPSISSPSQLQKKMGLLLQFLAKQKEPVSKSAVYPGPTVYLEGKT